MDEIKQVIYRMDEDMRLRGRSDSVRNNYERYAGWFLRQAGKPIADLTEAYIGVNAFIKYCCQSCH